MTLVQLLRYGLIVAGGFLLLGLLAALLLIATPFPAFDQAQDVFGFGDLGPTDGRSLPVLERYPARDGSEMAFRFYDSTASHVLVFIHGSSYHGAAYHALACNLSRRGAAKVYLPNLRGHYGSGGSGDIGYIGQLEDDLADLIEFARSRGDEGPVVLGGHSSGGGLVVRFAGGAYGDLVSAYLPVSPVIPLAPTVRGDDAGGWALLHQRRLYGLLALNAVGFHGLDGLPIIRFNKPEEYRDGTETLSYSYRLNTSYHPRFDYRADLAAMKGPVLVLVGADDEANDAGAFGPLLAGAAPDAELRILLGISHFEVFTDDAAFEEMGSWLEGLPGADPGQLGVSLIGEGGQSCQG